jgi:hypothetical protein
LILSTEANSENWVKETIKKEAISLKFTIERPIENRIQFLDLQVQCEKLEFCWKYLPREGKTILSCKSNHTRIIKHGFVQNVLQNSVKKSCEHEVVNSLKRQFEKLRRAGYTKQSLIPVIRKVIEKMNGVKKNSQDGEDKLKVVVIPYFHTISHHLKKESKKYDRNVVFFFPDKLQKLAAISNREFEECPKAKSKHIPFVKCIKNCVYSIPLTCGKQYIGQTKRCLNIRLTEHNKAKEDQTNEEYGNIKNHSSQCGCEPQFNGAQPIKKNIHDHYERLVWEAYKISEMQNNAVSAPSIALTPAEMNVLWKK